MNKNFIEETDESFLNSLKTKYKKIIQNETLFKSRVLISKQNLLKTDIILQEYKDETSLIVLRDECQKSICIMDIPPNWFYYFIGSNGVMKLKHERTFNIQIELYDEQKFTIIVSGEGKERFKEFVLDKIYFTIEN